MSPRATDTAALLLTGSVATLAAGGSVSLVLLTLSAVDPADLGIAAGGGVALILALAGLVSRLGRATRDAQPVTHHHTYNAPITQTSYTSHTSGLGRTRNTSEGR
ncbi:hypothetical protein GA0115246_103896 [Streptomyces sp. SolWspMP-sol7th]|nr:hypothetical protein [Streptomyces sp. SolWspMP-sol7th]SCD62329.1 hypothetical protein GA0115246_103896 [Streptomyces sp. SolWspMP-sol7th]